MPLFLCYALWKVNAISTRLERVEFECLGCCPCRTTVVALTSSAMRFKSRIRTLEKWLESAKEFGECACAYCLALKSCMNYVSGHAEHRRFKEGADLKQNLFHLVLWNIFHKKNHTCKAERPHLQHVLWVHGFAFMCTSVPWLTLSRQSSEW